MALMPKIQRYYLDADGVMNPTERDDLGEWIRAADVACVFGLGVFYMPVPRCDQCRWWERDDAGEPMGQVYGDSVCGHPRDLMYRSAGDDRFVWTKPAFGCVQWEAKGGE